MVTTQLIFVWFADVVVAAAGGERKALPTRGGHCLELTTLYSSSLVVLVVVVLSLSL